MHALYTRECSASSPLTNEASNVNTSEIMRANIAGVMRTHREKREAQILAARWVIEDHPQAELTLPPGPLGEIAQFILDASPKKVPHVAVGAAITLAAGLFGKSHNINGTGLNLYTVIVGPSGLGKEAASAGIDYLVNAIMQLYQDFTRFRGPSRIASGAALRNAIQDRPSCFSVINELGKVFEGLLSKKAAPHAAEIETVLLDLFGKSGWGRVLGESAYAGKEKTEKAISSPAFSLLGDTTPSVFDRLYDQSNIASGFLPRFITITYRGDIPYLSDDIQRFPPHHLVHSLADAARFVHGIIIRSEVVDVDRSPRADILLAAFERVQVDRMNAMGDDPMREMYNRLHLKVLRLSALVAVCRDHVTPVIEESDVYWAIDLVTADIRTLNEKVATGEIGSDDKKKTELIERATMQYLNLVANDPDKLCDRNGYNVPKKLVEACVIPFSFYRKYLNGRGVFDNDPRGAPTAVTASLADYIAQGKLVEITGDTARKELGLKHGVKLYQLAEQFPGVVNG